MVKDKVFFFLDGERVKQDLSANRAWRLTLREATTALRSCDSKCLARSTGRLSRITTSSFIAFLTSKIDD